MAGYSNSYSANTRGELNETDDNEGYVGVVFYHVAIHGKPNYEISDDSSYMIQNIREASLKFILRFNKEWVSSYPISHRHKCLTVTA